MELQPVNQQLLMREDSHENLTDVQSQTVPLSMKFGVERTSRIEIIRIIAFICLTAVLGVSLAVFVYVKVTSQGNENTQLWLLFACMAPVTYIFNLAWRRAILLYENFFWVRVELDSMRGKTLFNAVSLAIEEVAESRDDTACVDMLGTTEFDRKAGRSNVKLSSWNSRRKTMQLQIHDVDRKRRRLNVTYESGVDIVCG